MIGKPIPAPYEVLCYGLDGVVVIIADGIPQAAPTLSDGLRFLMSEGIALHPEHLSMCDALGIEVAR